MDNNYENTVKQDAFDFIENQVIAITIAKSEFPSLNVLGIKRLNSPVTIQVYNLKKLCDILDLDYKREDWDGNEMCNSNWDKLWFVYKNVEFFDLIEKEKENHDEGK